MSTIDIGIAEPATTSHLGANANVVPANHPLTVPAPEVDDFFYIGSVNIEAPPQTCPAS